MAPSETFDNARTNQWALALCTPKANTTFEYVKTEPIFSNLAEGVTR